MNPAVGEARAFDKGARARPFLITFSGIDGAGKTTQIENLSSMLQERGLRVLRLTFWDHVAVWPNMRAGVSTRAVDSGEVHGGAKGSFTPEFTPRNSKHVRKWYLRAARSGLYLLDVARLRHVLAGEAAINSDVVIFDRYIYDQLANIYAPSFAARMYGKSLLMQAPVPDLAFILDASPIEAFERKPEYPLEFMHEYRKSFLRLRELAPELIVIEPAGPEEVKSEINLHIRDTRLFRDILPERKSGASSSSSSGLRSSPSSELL